LLRQRYQGAGVASAEAPNSRHENTIAKWDLMPPPGNRSAVGRRFSTPWARCWLA